MDDDYIMRVICRGRLLSSVRPSAWEQVEVVVPVREAGIEVHCQRTGDIVGANGDVLVTVVLDRRMAAMPDHPRKAVQ
jgi:hypothetical protein